MQPTLYMKQIIFKQIFLQAKFKFAAERQLASLVEWAKHIPHFTELPLEDQVVWVDEDDFDSDAGAD